MKTKICLLISGILIVILAISSLWLYTRTNTLQKQVSTLQRDKDNLQIQINNLQSQIDSLNATYQNCMATHSYSNFEYNALQIELTNLQIQVNNLEANNTNLQNQVNSLQWQIDSLLNELDEARFSFYYVKPPDQKFGVYDLSDELNGLEWMHPYEADVFDCSEMSACLEWYLENKGWHAKIVVGDTPFGTGRHAWLLVETSVGHYMPVESVTIEVVWWSNPNFDNYWIYDHKFETIQDAIAYNERGFDWWESTIGIPLRSE